MDDPNMTMEEYIKLKEEKARRRGWVFNWQTTTYGKIRVDDDLHDLSSVEAEFPAIVINDAFAPQDALQCKSQVSIPVNNEIDFRISFDESDDEDYTIICDKNSFSYKMIYVNDLKMDSENDNEKVIPSIPSPEPTTIYIDDLEFFNDFKNEFPAIVYNDAQTSKSDLLTEPILNPRHIDEFNLNDETSVSEYDEEEQNILYFNDIFPFNIIRLDDLNSEKDNDDNDINIIQSSEGSKITHMSNVLMDTSCDKINKIFNEESFVLELNMNIVTWIYLFNGMLLCFIMNLYVPFGIPFDPKRYYKDDMALPPREQRHRFLRYKGLEYSDIDIVDFEGVSLFTSRAWRRLFDIKGSLVHELILEFFSTFRFGQAILDLDTPGALQFQLRGARRRMSWREFILALGLHTDEEMQTAGFGAYWADSSRQIPNKGDLRDYWIGILSAGDFLGTTPSYTMIRDLILRLCHRLIACSIAGSSQAPEKLVARLAEHFGLLTAKILGGLTVIAPELLTINMAELVSLQIFAEDAPTSDEGDQAVPTPVQAPQQPPPPPPTAARTIPQRLGRLEEDVQGLRRDVRSLRGLVERSMTDQGRFSTWMISGLTYQEFNGTFRGSSPLAFQRRTRQRTDGASTSAAQRDSQQPDP
ncbi:hypothetical protein Tco_0289934 [Tanacetum coccineum]